MSIAQLVLMQLCQTLCQRMLNIYNTVLRIYNNNTWQWKEKSHFLPLLSALYGEFLKGRGKLKLRRSFSSALKSLPNRCHDYFTCIRQFLTEETSELKIHRGNCCVTSPTPDVSGMAGPRAAASFTHAPNVNVKAAEDKRRQIRGNITNHLGWTDISCTPMEEWLG